MSILRQKQINFKNHVCISFGWLLFWLWLISGRYLESVLYWSCFWTRLLQHQVLSNQTTLQRCHSITRSTTLLKSLWMEFHKIGGVKTPETRKLYWWLRCMELSQLSQEITVSVFAAAYRARQYIETPNWSYLEKCKEMFFIDPTSQTSAVRMILLIIWRICILPNHHRISLCRILY